MIVVLVLISCSGRVIIRHVSCKRLVFLVSQLVRTNLLEPSQLSGSLAALKKGHLREARFAIPTSRGR